ncbi:MAG TPA: tyrosine-type recombinase/integrase [Microbacteriaceae bacterium]|nr:tyrosine-type recombinase/integrase [Microbacteriaceae bacterium]
MATRRSTTRPRRRKGEGSISGPDKLGRYRGRLQLESTEPGKRKQAVFWGRSVDEVVDKMEEAKSELREHGSLSNRSVTVAQYYERWLATIALARYKPLPYSGVQGYFRKWILPAIGKKRIADLRPSHILGIYQAVNLAGRSSSTSQKLHWAMSRFFEDARREFRIPNVIKDVDPPKIAPVKRGALSIPHAMAVLEEADRREDGTRWWVSLLGGIRQGERIGALRDSVDRRSREFIVQWSMTPVPMEHGCGGSCGHPRAGNCPAARPVLQPGLEHRHIHRRLYLVRPKSGKVRRFPLIDPVYDRLVEYLDQTEDDPNPHGLLWHRPDGTPWADRQDQAEWRDVLFKAGVITAEQSKEPKFRLPGTPETPTTHFARHTMVTLLMELGVPDSVIGRIVGHLDATTTALYQHPTAEMERDAMRRLGERLVRGGLG